MSDRGRWRWLGSVGVLAIGIAVGLGAATVAARGPDSKALGAASLASTPVRNQSVRPAREQRVKPSPRRNAAPIHEEYAEPDTDERDASARANDRLEEQYSASLAAALRTQSEDPGERHAALLALHRSQARNERWASAAESSLENALAPEKLPAGASLEGLSCSDRICEVDLSFDDANAASQGFRDVLQLPMKPNCSRDLPLVEPADPTQRVKATMVVFCSELEMNQPDEVIE